MNTYKYTCSHCSYCIETSGPWPYYGKGKKSCHEDSIRSVAEPILGLIADIYCPVCDAEKQYVIVKYKTPANVIDDIWLQNVPKKIRMVCNKCKHPVFLVLPERSVTCPRCKMGTFQHSIPLEPEGDYINCPIAPPKGPLRVVQNGQSIAVPKPTVIIDSAEHMGYTFYRFTNWFAGSVRKRMPVGDYTLLGMEDEIAVERKTISDLVSSIINNRSDFIAKCERMSSFKKKCFVIEGSLSSVKTPYVESQASPNAVLGSIIAVQERWDIPVYFLDNLLLAEEFVASMLSKYHAYRWLEENGYKRCLIEGDI